MKFKFNNFVIIAILAVFVVFSFADAAIASDLAKDQDRLTSKSSPKRVIYGAEFDHGMILTDYLTEGFESWFPADWTRVITNAGYTWNQVYTSSYEGSASAEIVYDPALVPQDEWMITPTLDFSNANNELQVEFYFLTSYYWHVDPTMVIPGLNRCGLKMITANLKTGNGTRLYWISVIMSAIPLLRWRLYIRE